MLRVEFDLTLGKQESAEVRFPMLANTGSSADESSSSREDREDFPFRFFLIRGLSSSSEDNFRSDLAFPWVLLAVVCGEICEQSFGSDLQWFDGWKCNRTSAWTELNRSEFNVKVHKNNHLTMWNSILYLNSWLDSAALWCRQRKDRWNPSNVVQCYSVYATRSFSSVILGWTFFYLIMWW